jgi:hypothetical protein
MKTRARHAFVSPLLVASLVGVLAAGSTGLGVVWTRHQVSRSANSIRKMETQVAAVERSLAEVNSEVAGEQSPDVLARRNREMAIGLVLPREQQVVRVAGSAERRLLAKRNAEIFSDRASAATARDEAVLPVRFELGLGSTAPTASSGPETPPRSAR